MNMGLAPLHNLAKLRPVVHIFKCHQFHRRAGNHHTVKLSMLQILKALIERADFTTITAADGTSWYKQYAQDTVKRTPYTAPNGQVAYREEVVKELPNPPQRKDKV